MLKQTAVICASVYYTSMSILSANAAGADVHAEKQLRPDQVAGFHKESPARAGQGSPMGSYTKPQQTGAQFAITSFVKEEARRHPLPDMKIVQEELLNSGLILNIGEKIIRAYTNSPAEMSLLGSLYLSFLDIEKAQAFLLHAAMQHNADAFWSLSSIYRNKHIVPTISNLDALLLNEADRLGSPDAKLFKRESGSN